MKARSVPDPASSGGREMVLFGTGTITRELTTPAVSRIAVRARGDQCVGAPIMEVRVDGAIVLTTVVDSAEHADHAAAIDLPAGVHTVGVAFLNDKVVDNVCDRNLRVDKVSLVGAAVPAATGTGEPAPTAPPVATVGGPPSGSVATPPAGGLPSGPVVPAAPAGVSVRTALARLLGRGVSDLRARGLRGLERTRRLTAGTGSFTGGRVSLRLTTSAGQTVGLGRATVRAGRSGGVTLRVGASGRARLQGRRSVRLVLRATHVAANGRKTSAVRSLTLKR